MYHDDRTERNYSRRHDSRHDRYDGRYDSRHDSRDSRDSRYDRRYDRDDRNYRSDHYRRSGYERRDYGRGGGSFAPVKRENPPMTKEQLERRVYCHNVSYKSSWQDLKDYMRQAGDVEHVRIMEDSEGRSRGCAVVMYTKKEGARKAIKQLNDTQFAGRSIFVREDRAYSERKASRDSRGHDSYSDSSSDSDSREHRRSSHRDSHRRHRDDDHRRSSRERHRHRSHSRSRSRSRSSRSSSHDEERRHKDRYPEDDGKERSTSHGDDKESSRDEEDRRSGSHECDD